MANEPTIELAVDTIKRNKQALVFVNSKKRAEKTAEDIAKSLTVKSRQLDELSVQLKNALSRPTKQCIRLSECSRKGVVFHHAGLVSKQRELIEDNFRSGLIKIICSTPTLALGVNLPAFRTIIKDLKRYGIHGYNYIPVMEYHQMCGRAGRPGKEKFGEAITEVSTENEQEKVVENYIKGLPEPILSKLAVEPVLRTYILSLIATEFVGNEKQIFDFFRKTFWAFQFGDMREIQNIIVKMLRLLEENNFITTEKQDFVSAAELGKEKHNRITATLLGKRVAELYIDPLSAVDIIATLEKAMEKEHSDITYLYMICKCLELRPLLKVKISEFDRIQEQLARHEEHILDEASEFSDDYDLYLDSFKTALVLKDWIEEKDEDYILEKYNIRPGELNIKVANSDWLLYSAEEIAKIIKAKKLLSEIMKLRIRMKYGVREELLALLKLKKIGRARARKMYNAGLKDIGKVRKVSIATLAQLIGKNLAIDIKEQLGEKVTGEIKIKKTGQTTISDY